MSLSLAAAPFKNGVKSGEGKKVFLNFPGVPEPLWDNGLHWPGEKVGLGQKKGDGFEKTFFQF